MKKRTKQLIVLIVSIVVIIGSVSYALWNRTLIQEGENRITAGCFDIEIEDDGDFIKLDDTYPMTDEMGIRLKPYSFRVKNTCTVDAKYEIHLDILNDSNIADDNIKMQLDNFDIGLLSDERVNNNFDSNNYQRSYKIFSGYLTGKSTEDASDGEVQTHELRLWLKDMNLEDNYSDVADHSFKAKISVTGVPYNIPNAFCRASSNLNANYNAGDLITLCTDKSEEQFYVIKDDGETITALTKYNLYVGRYCDPSYSGVDDMNVEARCPNMIEESSPGYNLQNAESIGYSARPETGIIPFSDTAYWWDEYNNTWAEGYEPKDGSGYSYIYDQNSNLYPYVENYKNILINNGCNIKEARLLNREEVNILSSIGYIGDYYNGFKNTSYWFGYTQGYHLGIVGSEVGRINYGYNSNYSSTYYFGLSPVIEISKNSTHTDSRFVD